MSEFNLDYERLAKEMLKQFPGNYASVTLLEFTKQIISYAENNRAKKTCEGVKLVCKKLLNFFPPVRKLDTILLKDVENFLDSQKKNAPKGIYNYQRTLRAMWNKAKQWNYVQSNPFEQVKLKKRQNQKPAYVTEQQLGEIINHIESEVVRDAVVTTFLTGCRLGETVNLTWKDVDLKNDLLTIGNEHFQTKSRKIRQVPIHPKVREILLRRVNSKKYAVSSQEEEKRIIKLPDKDAYVFGKGGRFKFTGDYFSKQFKRACRSAGIDENIHYHSLRHGAITAMLMKGANIPAVQKIAGHTDIKITLSYTHPDMESLRDAVGRL